MPNERFPGLTFLIDFLIVLKSKEVFVLHIHTFEHSYVCAWTHTHPLTENEVLIMFGFGNEVLGCVCQTLDLSLGTLDLTFWTTEE